jgi:hypothetical protein
LLFFAPQLKADTSHGFRSAAQGGMLALYGILIFTLINLTNNRAVEIDLDAPGNVTANGLAKEEPTDDTRFSPMRRKWVP